MDLFKNRKISIKAKLFLAFLTVAICVILVGAASFIFGQRTIVEYRKIALKNLPTSVIVTSQRGIAKDLRAMIFKLAAAENSPEDLQTIADKIDGLISDYEDSMKEYTLLPFVDGEEKIFENTNLQWKTWVPIIRSAIAARLKKDDNKEWPCPKFS